METYRINFNTSTLRLSVHAVRCARVAGTRKTEVHFDIEAPTPVSAAEVVYEDENGKERGLKFPTICTCTEE